MYCIHCGTKFEDATAAFCINCGRDKIRSTENPPAPVADGVIKSRLGTGAKIWCGLCFIANLAAIVMLALALGRAYGHAVPLLIFSTVAAGVAALGYLILLIGRKEGFVIICTVGMACLIFNFLNGNLPGAVIGLVNPLLTGLIIKKSWPRLNTPGKKNKSRLTALVLAILPTAFFGIDRFYLGYIWTGFLKWLTVGGFLVWYIVDIVRIARGTMPDKYRRPLHKSGA